MSLHYVRHALVDRGGLAVSSVSAWLEPLLDSGTTLHAWASAQPGARALRGRGVVYAIEAPVPGPDARSRWAVRHYRRGGLVASYLGDRYVRGGSTRPEREARASAEARKRGIRTPAVVAAAWYYSGAFYRADLITELIPGARSLADLLFSAERTDDAIEMLALAGELVRDLGAGGILHPDLNAMNVLLCRQNDEWSAHVVDLDGARALGRAGGDIGSAMRRRLARSLRKLEKAARRPLSRDEWAALDAGFGDSG